MSTHTPGPWFIRYCDDEAFMCMTVISTKDYGRSNDSQFDNEEDTIAVVYHQLTPVVMQEADDANARLIAAAPDLLQVLKDIEAMLNAGLDASIVMDENSPMRDAMRDAIAKAEGGAV